jgi:hypothetical protein
VAIDGSKFKAVNSRDRNFTPAKIAARKKQIDESIERNMSDLEAADRNHPGEFVAKIARLTDKVKTLQEQMRRMDGSQKQLDKQQEAQISLTDPDSRSMMSQAKGPGVVGYNVQVAVDTKHHLIAAHEVTNATSDRQQLAKMAQAAREAMSKPRLRAYADRGYFNGPQIKDCDDSGIVPFVPKPMTSNAKAASTRATSSTSPRTTSTNVRPGSARSIATPARRTGSRSTDIGVAPARNAR